LLTSGGLSSEVTRSLPDGVETWQSIDAYSSGATHNLKQSAGVILEYEITLGPSLGKKYDDDSYLGPFAQSMDATVVTIVSDSRAVIAQKKQRLSQLAMSRSLGKNIWRYYISLPLKKMRRFFLGLDPSEKTKRFQAPDYLDSCYRRWREFVTVECAARRWKCVEVRASDSVGRPNFTLMSGQPSL
jgi:hypothetical protein